MKKIFRTYFMLALCALFNTAAFSQVKSAKELSSNAWRFIVLGDTHVAQSDTVKEMIPFMLADNPTLILVCGDLVDAGKNASGAELETQLKEWISVVTPLYNKGIGIYPVRGNHEDDAKDDITIWNKIFSGSKALPQNGPAGELNLTYSFIKNNAMFIGLDNYINIHRVNQEWLNKQLASNTSTHIFAFGHEAAFKVFHSDCLDDYQPERNLFWQSLVKAGARTYFCGHDHFYDVSRIDDNDGNMNNDIYQVLAGGGGGWLMSNYNYNGLNSPYKPIGVFHKKVHGYALVEISGTTNADCDVTITFKERTFDAASSAFIYAASKDIIKYTAAFKTQTGIEKTVNTLPANFLLEQNYPNPFNPQTTISYQLNEPGFVQLKIYNSLGMEMEVLVSEEKQPGYYTVNFDAGKLSSGIYFYRLSSHNYSQTKRLILLK